MRKYLSLIILFSILCLSLYSCDIKSEPTDTTDSKAQDTEYKTSERADLETGSVETEKNEDLLEEINRMASQLVRDNKIDIPNKEIDYIQYEHKIILADQAPNYYYSEKGDELIFRRKEKIEEIVSFFEEAQLEEKVWMPTGMTSEHLRFYFTDGTYVEFTLFDSGILGGYINETGENIFWKYGLPAYDELGSVICK